MTNVSMVTASTIDTIAFDGVSVCISVVRNHVCIGVWSGWKIVVAARPSDTLCSLYFIEIDRQMLRQLIASISIPSMSFVLIHQEIRKFYVH